MNAARAVSARAGTHATGRHQGAGTRPRFAPVHGLQRTLGNTLVQHRDAPRALQRTGEEGTTRFTETVGPHTETGGVFSGNVDRTVTAPASGTEPEQEVHSGVAAVEFDSNACVVRLPYRYRFVAGTVTAADICRSGPAPTAPVSAERLAEIRDSYISTVNEMLNGWYAVRLEGSGCSAGCAGRDIPIRAQVSAVTAGGDQTITVVNRGGRANAATICAPSYAAGTVTHEAGHQVLGAGDEYRERNAGVLAAVPQWGRVERVRSTDWSFMGNHHAYGSFALFHQRHFAHVPAFLHAIYPGCQARLVELNRPLIPDVRIGLAGGYSYFGDTHGGYLSGGVDVGLPFTRLREWEALIGVHASLLSQANGDRRLALLAGLRAGLEYTHQPSAGGFRIGGFGEIGGGGVSMAPRPGADQEWAPTAYLEAGGYLGYRSGGGNALSIAAEFAGGSTIVPVPAAVAPGLDLRDDENLTWFRAGVRAAVEF